MHECGGYSYIISVYELSLDESGFNFVVLLNRIAKPVGAYSRSG